MKYLPALFFSLSLLTGCASQRYSKFSGSQIWPVTKGDVADNACAVPVYGSWPERPYRVIGGIQLAEKKWTDGDIVHAGRIAKAKGADALVIQNGGEFNPSEMASNAAYASVFSPVHAGALVIQWKPQSEVEESSHRLDGFRAYG